MHQTLTRPTIAIIVEWENEAGADWIGTGKNCGCPGANGLPHCLEQAASEGRIISTAHGRRCHAGLRNIAMCRAFDCFDSTQRCPSQLENLSTTIRWLQAACRNDAGFCR